MKSTLPSIRIEIETKESIIKAIEKFNESSLLKISLQEFRRLSYEFFSKIILQNKETYLKKLLQMQ